MSQATSKRTRTERVQALPLPPGRMQQLSVQIRRSAMWTRLGMALLAAASILVVCQSWMTPFAYRTGYIPPRDMIARITFSVPDETQTRTLREQRRREAIVYYENRPDALGNRREALKDQLFLVLSAASLDRLSEEGKKAWAEFFDADETAPETAALDAFASLKATFNEDPELKQLDEVIQAAQRPLIQHGLLTSLSHSIEKGNQGKIYVYNTGNPQLAKQVDVETVRIATAKTELMQRVLDEMKLRFPTDEASSSAEMIAKWLTNRMPETLIYNPELSERARIDAANSVKTVMTPYTAGATSLADAGKPLSSESLDLLHEEWTEVLASQSVIDRVLRVGANFGMIMALYLLVGGYIYFVDDRDVLLDPLRLARLLTLSVVTIGLCRYASEEQWQSEVIPITMAAMTAAIVYGRELSLVLLSAICLATTLLIGQDVNELVTLAAASLSCILLLGRIRNRVKPLYVGLGAAAVAAATVVGAGIVTSQTMSGGQAGPMSENVVRLMRFESLTGILLSDAGWVAACTIVASALMTALLPLVEKFFGIQTDLSLLELGDASHPLLRQLAQRAPGTYNHSINVASIAEAAAERIGANGLLVRVGAYFHDIGKMFKPDYFIENQGQGPNQHDSLQPAMSTLVIIAHVKDGADLARSHHLPEPIIDFILQHHGTTLVEYFYRQAAKKSEEDPNGDEVSDKDFRYPGPKPQTLEAAVLMLSDAVESASRALVDPTPARIASLVDSIVMKKLTDRQFDECGLTLLQLDIIRQSLIKSLTAIYHARVKYPGQQSA